MQLVGRPNILLRNENGVGFLGSQILDNSFELALLRSPGATSTNKY